MPTKELTNFANDFNLSPVFLRRLKVLFMRLDGAGGLKGKEYQEYRDKSERFTNQIIQQLKDNDQ